MTAVPAITVAGLRSHLRVPVLRAGYSLVASSVATSALGAIYWFVAARRFDTESVGIGSALVAATSLLGGMANLGLKNGLLRFVPTAGRGTARLITRSYAISVLAAVALGGAFLAGLRVWSPSLVFLRSSPLTCAVFVVTLAAWAVFVLQDSVLVGIGRAPWVLSENLVFSLAKIAILVLIVGIAPRWGIFLSWGAPTLVLLAAVNWAIARHWLEPHVRSLQAEAPSPFARVMRFSFADQAATLLWLATLDGLPLLVLRRSGPSAAAYYYLSAQIAYGLYVVSGCIGAALLAEAARDPARAKELNRRVSRQAFGLVVPTTVAVVIAAPWALRVFGGEYERHATGLLRLLALSAVPYTVTSLALSRARVRQQMKVVVAGHAAIFVLCVGAAAALQPRHGLAGVGTGVLLGQSAVAAAVLTMRFGRVEAAPGGGLVAQIAGLRNRLRRLDANRRLEALLARIDLPDDLLDGRARLISAHNDMVIAELSGPDRDVVVKVATSRRARAGLIDHVRSLHAVGTNRARDVLGPSIPVLIGEAASRRCRYAVETRCDGTANSPALLDEASRPTAMGAVAAYIVRFHSLTARQCVVDEAMVEAMVDRPLAIVAARCAPGSARTEAQIRSLREELGAALLGRRLVIARTHGDLTPGNVLLSADGSMVTGLVDWESSRADGIPDLDRAMFVLALRRERTGAEFGPMVLEAAANPLFFDPVEASFLEGPPNDADRLSNRHRVLLAWLAHIESNLRKSGRYGSSRIWLRRNVLAVVEGLSFRTALLDPSAVARRPSAPPVAPRRPIRTPHAVHRHRSAIGTTAILGVAAAVWLAALRQVDVRAMTDLGLVSVLPSYGWAAIAVVVLAVVHSLTRPSLPERRLLALVSGYLVLLHGAAPILYQTVRYSWAWKHVGIVDYIDRHGTVNPHIAALDVYHNWPGFFSANAALVELIGTKNAVVFAMWAPVISNLLNLGALLLLLPTLCPDRRVVWTAVWLFFLGNWVGQDYFSPQAMAYFLHLVILGLLLANFRRRRPSVTAVHTRSDAPASSRTTGERRLTIAVGLTILSLAVTNISSHQLTPAMMLVAMGLLLATRRIKAAWVVTLTLAGQALWLLGPARTFAAKNLKSTLASFGAPVENAGATLRDTTSQSAGQAWVSLAGRGVVALMAVLAVIGIGRRVRRGHRDGTALLLLCSPALLIVANEFGGEILFRAYLFAMPFLALFAAWALLPAKANAPGRLGTVVLALVSVALFCGFALAHFGKDRSFHFSKEEVAAATYLDRQAISPTLLIEGSRNYPAQFLNYERFVYVPITEEPPDGIHRLLANPAVRLEAWLDDPRYARAYVLITRSQKADLEAEGILPAGALETLERALRQSPKFTVEFENRDATVFRLASRKAAR